MNGFDYPRELRKLLAKAGALAGGSRFRRVLSEAERLTRVIRVLSKIDPSAIWAEYGRKDPTA